MVVGAGQMGAGIAQVFAAHGHEVLLNDVDEARIKHGIDGIAKRLQRDVEKGRLKAEARGRILEHIDPRPHFHDLEISLAIEAATEDFDTKVDLFHRLDENTAPDTILATNTSSMSITSLGAATSKPERVIGMHFMNPVPVMAAGRSDSRHCDERCDRPRHRRAGVVARQDAGRSTRLPRFHREPHPDADDQRSDLRRLRRRGVDRCDRHGDEAGHEPSDGTADAGRLHRPRHVSGDHERAVRRLRRLEVSARVRLLKQYVAAGWLGKKSGRGFYDYRGTVTVPAVV